MRDLIVLLVLLVVASFVVFFARAITILVLDVLEVIINHFVNKRTIDQTVRSLNFLFDFHSNNVDDFIYSIRARLILYWHISWLGTKIDSYLIGIRKNKHHHSLVVDESILHFLNQKDKELYTGNIIKRRTLAYYK